MEIQEGTPLGKKTTMRIGGTAKFFAELRTKEDVAVALQFAKERNVPFIVLGSGSNTLFADGVIDAFVVRILAEKIEQEGEVFHVEAGANLQNLINALALRGYDLSPLTGIPGTLGGAVFGNAGQGPKGIWIDRYIPQVEACIDGVWKIFPSSECQFRYRESIFKSLSSPIIWSVALRVPKGETSEIQKKIDQLLRKRIETQPHVRTAGSCFKARGDTPAWQLIDHAGLRGAKVGGVEISPKHANFLINTGGGTFADATEIIRRVREACGKDLEVEMRFIQEDGTLLL